MICFLEWQRRLIDKFLFFLISGLPAGIEASLSMQSVFTQPLSEKAGCETRSILTECEITFF